MSCYKQFYKLEEFHSFQRQVSFTYLTSNLLLPNKSLTSVRKSTYFLKGLNTKSIRMRKVIIRGTKNVIQPIQDVQSALQIA